MENHTAIVYKIFYRNEKNFYSIFSARIGESIETLTGYFPILNTGLKISFYGKKEMGKNKKEQYKVRSYSMTLPESKKHLHSFLTNDHFKLSNEIAMSIAEKIGITYLKKHHDFKFLENKLGPSDYNKYSKILKSVSYDMFEVKRKIRLMKKMGDMGFNGDIAAKVSFSELKITADEINMNPYVIIQPFDIPWEQVDSIALKNGTAIDSPIRIKEGICHVLDLGVQKQSNMFLHRQIVHRSTNRLLQLNLSSDDFRRFEQVLIQEERLVSDIDNNIYGYKYFLAEKQLAMDLHRILSQEGPSEKAVQKGLSLLDKIGTNLSTEQADAVRSAIVNPLTIITGPAGSGKTFTLRTIIEVLKGINEREEGKDPYNIQLFAPTGRAAERMHETTGLTARTNHALLSHHPLFKTPKVNEYNPMKVDCVIFDESSMNDTIIFSELLNAVPAGATVIIVGDADQLPSIGPGNVLYELTNSPNFPVIRLKTIFRQGEDSAIRKLGVAIRGGQSDIKDFLLEKHKDLSFININDAQEIADTIINTTEVLLEKEGFDFYGNCQIVTPIHKGPFGTIELNRRIQKLLNLKKQRVMKVSFADKDFYVDDKVVHTINNKNLNVSNGEVGKVIDIYSKQIVVRYANDKIITYEGDELFELELGFATTVHKMQGSETSLLIVPVHHMYGKMLERRLLYTAITRAKTKLLLLGQIEAFIKGIATDTALERNCSIKKRFVEAQFELV